MESNFTVQRGMGGPSGLVFDYGRVANHWSFHVFIYR